MVGMLFTGSEVFTAESISPANPLVIILIGPPGAGKGTHAGPLSDQLGVPHIATGDLFRENIRNETPLGKKAKVFIDQGKLVPDELVLDMLFSRTAQKDCAQGYILDGFPRTLSQAQALDTKIKNKNQLLVIHFDVPNTIILERITGRMMCKTCGRPYHKTFDPPIQDRLCDSCNGSLYQRDDDQKEVVLKRLDVYHQQTQPVIEYFSKKQKVLHQIDSSRQKEQIYEALLAVIPIPTNAMSQK
jgi:adenylate kinase